jgi:hypothetical protein
MTSPDSPPSPDSDELPYALQSRENYMEWMQQPGNLDNYEEALRNTLNKVTDAPPEIRELIQKSLANIGTVRLVARLKEKMAAVKKLLNSVRPTESHERWKVIAQAQALMEEITNEALDLPEPHRTKLLPQQVALCEQLRAFKV